jgi:hypothetical protein
MKEEEWKKTKICSGSCWGNTMQHGKFTVNKQKQFNIGKVGLFTAKQVHRK